MLGMLEDVGGLEKKYLVKAWHIIGLQWHHPTKPGSKSWGTQPSSLDSEAFPSLLSTPLLGPNDEGHVCVLELEMWTWER